jgi:septal ring factor EnvC (AmiA/AmiB activator)
MIDSETRKKLKRIQKEIKKIEKEIKKVEFRPCRGDADLKEKDKDLERERDRYILDTGRINHGG